MRTTAFVAGALGLVALGLSACLDLDEYTLVPGSPPYTGGGGGQGQGGTGGTPEECLSATSQGIVFATRVAEASTAGSGEGACAVPSDLAGGLDVFAFEAGGGECLASARVVERDGATLSSDARVSHSSSDVVYVAGSFRGGSLELPQSCVGGSTVLATEEPGATDSLFVAGLRVAGAGFCTELHHVAWTDDPAGAGRLAVRSVSPGPQGVAIAGSLGGVTAHFEDEVVTGGSFFARVSATGTLVEALAFGSTPDDGAMALGSTDFGWLASGTLQHESPECHGCTGQNHVANPAGSCDAVGGAGGGGGAGGAAGGGGSGGAAPDSQNAFLFRRQSSDGTCLRLDTFGADQDGDSDAQIGYGVSARGAPTSCRAYWTGMAGRGTWRFNGADPLSALFDTGGASVDAFVTRFDGSSTSDCGNGAGHAWNLRLSPTPVNAVVWGNRVDANRCSDGAVLTAFADQASGKTLGLHHCDAAGMCQLNASAIALASGPERQLVVIDLTPEGALRWFSAFGPVAEGADALAGGSPVGATRDNLARAPNDNLSVLVETTGSMTIHNLEAFSCGQVLDSAPPAGTYLFHLNGGGLSDKGRCEWVRRLDR